MRQRRQNMFATKYKVKVIKSTEKLVIGLGTGTSEEKVDWTVVDTKDEAIKEGERMCIEKKDRRNEMIKNDPMYEKMIKFSQEEVHFYYTIEEIYWLQ